MVDFVATGGYALKTYERFARIKQDKQGRWRVTNPRVRQSYRLNVGTIVEEAMLKVRLVRSRGGGSGSTGAIARGGRMLGEIEEYFIEGLVVGDTFVFGGEVVRYEALVGRPGLCLPRQRQGRRKCRPIWAASFRSRPISPSGCANLLDDKRAWKGLAGSGARLAVAAGGIFRACPACANCWSKPFRAATSIISSAIPSRGGWRIRRSACS